MWNRIRRDITLHNEPAIILNFSLGIIQVNPYFLREACQHLGTVEDLSALTKKTKFMTDFFSLIVRVYSDINEQRDAEYWDYENFTTFSWG